MATLQWSEAMCSPANACATLYVTQQLPVLSNCNIERAQVLQAFEASACSQGCMNNFLFGDSSFGYYETIAGGSGAGPFFDGTSGVHTHMTNTRITDPEILERRWGSFVVVFRLFCFCATFSLPRLLPKVSRHSSRVFVAFGQRRQRRRRWKNWRRR